MKTNMLPIRTYRDLQQQIHDDLRAQHPEWIESNGESPICDGYERRLAQLIQLFQAAELGAVHETLLRVA
jgi:hypothetical protein